MNTAQNDLARRHLGLVHACCKRFAGKGIDYEELYAAGCLGLSKAINRFDASMGCRFSTYAFPVITGEIKRLFRDGGSVRVSRSVRELNMKINRLNEESRSKNGADLTLSQLAEMLDVSVEKIAEAIGSGQPVLSLTCDNSDGAEPGYLAPSPDIQEDISERLSLNQALSRLGESDRQLISLRYYQGKTQTQTAEILGMTQVQVSRKEKKILARLREMLV